VSDEEREPCDQPELVLRFALESAPRIEHRTASDDDARRLADWLLRPSRDRYVVGLLVELLEAIDAAERR
jgi:hypothetical protein